MRKIVAVVFLAFLLSGCAFWLAGSGLEPRPVKKSDIEGTFTAILYGANHMNDLETIAILDKEGDGYEFEPYAPEFVYRIKKHIPAKEALSEAEKFVSWHYSFRSVQLGRIPGPEGRTIGYEVRPLYYPLDFGLMDVLDVNYFLRGDKVIVIIELKDIVERRLSGEDSKGIFDW